MIMIVIVMSIMGDDDNDAHADYDDGAADDDDYDDDADAGAAAAAGGGGGDNGVGGYFYDNDGHCDKYIVTDPAKWCTLPDAEDQHSSLVQKPGNGKKRYVYYPWVVVFYAAALSPATYRLLSYVWAIKWDVRPNTHMRWFSVKSELSWKSAAILLIVWGPELHKCSAYATKDRHVQRFIEFIDQYLTM